MYGLLINPVLTNQHSPQFGSKLLITLKDVLFFTSQYYILFNWGNIFSYFCFFNKFFLKYLFIYLSLAALGLHCCAWAFSSCSEQWLLLLWSTGSVVVAHGLQSAGSVVVAHRLVAPRHVGSSQTRARTRVPCIGRRILNHCATREAPFCYFWIQLHYGSLSKVKLVLKEELRLNYENHLRGTIFSSPSYYCRIGKQLIPIKVVMGTVCCC